MSRASGSLRRRVVAVCAFALCGCALVSGAGAALRVDPTELYVNYTGANSVQVTVGGQVVRSGGSIPAGLYTVLVYVNGYNDSPRFLMSGPSVSINDNLNSTGMGVDGVSTFGPYAFPAGASYTVQQQGGPTVTFSTTASAGGSSSGGSSSGGSSSGGTSSGGSSSGGTSSGGSSSGGSSGSSGGTSMGGSSGTGATKMMGTLKAAVSVSGKGTLTFGGKTPKTLKAGRYTVTVNDRSRKAGLIVGQTAKHPMTLSAAARVGKSSHSVTLTAGKWFFAASATGPKTYFTVA
jgi:hypothetical protein